MAPAHSGTAARSARLVCATVEGDQPMPSALDPADTLPGDVGDGRALRVLITGAAGFVGSHLCEALLAGGHDVVGLDGFVASCARPLKEGNLAGAWSHPRFRFCERDLAADPLEGCLDGIDVVVHLAAMAGLPRSWKEYQLYVDCNVIATQRLLEGCRNASLAKLVHISTSSVYGLDAVGDETCPTRPVSPYGVTKLAAERLVLAYVANHGVPATILRLFSIYGPRQRPDMAYNIFIDALRNGRPLTVFGDGLQSRSNTFISDCVRGTIQAIHGAEVGEIYNIGGREPIILNQAIEWISECLGVSPVVVNAPGRPGDQRHTLADTAKARASFGYRPRVPPRLGLRLQTAWQLGATGRPAVGRPVHLSHESPRPVPPPTNADPVPERTAAACDRRRPRLSGGPSDRP
ncbi:N/A [soil metagenome]